MQPITLYGFGYVGKAVWRFLRDHYAVHIIDPAPNRDGLTDDENPVIHSTHDETIPPCDMAVVCVPTQMREDGTCDTSIVETILRAGNHKHYLVKSTVTPGTCERLAQETGRSVTHSPEFIGEGKYEIPWWKDMPHPTNMKLHSFHIFGGPREATREWVRTWQRVAGWAATYAQTDSTTSEFVKYMENMMLATRKIFFSEMFLAAGAIGIDYNEAKELLLLDGRIGRAMSLVWPEKLHYDGKCLPKDTSAIVEYLTSRGHDPMLWRAVVERNKELRDMIQSRE